MRRQGKILSLVLVLMLSLAACGGTAEEPNGTEETEGGGMAGHYIVYGFYNDGSYIYNDQITGSIDLEEDGTGYLDWGEDNQGPITEWSADGEDLTFQAGVATITGTVKEGVMVLDTDSFHLWLAREDVDPESLDPIAAEDYTPAAGEETEETRALAGTYYIYGVEQDGDCVSSPYFPDEEDSWITLNADGTGALGSGSESSQITWSVEGTDIAWKDAKSGIDAPYATSVKSEGILALADGENGVIYYYALADADVSGLNAHPAE